MSDRIVIAHLYPKEMSIYGDRGNVIALVKRLAWRGYRSEVIEVGIGDRCNFVDVDIVVAGGGQDRGQNHITEDLASRSTSLADAAAAGVVMLAVCGSYQLFGHSFTTVRGRRLPGIGLFDAHTVANSTRMVGNIVVDTAWGPLVGFENHSGETILGPDQEPLGAVVRGCGNTSARDTEGAIADNVYGTYLHGPLLPTNSRFTDHLLSTALRRRWPDHTLQPLDDGLELAAVDAALARP